MRVHFSSHEEPLPYEARDVCASHHGGNPESVAAFECIKRRAIDALKMVYDFIKAKGNAIPEEIERGLGLRRSTVGARCTEGKHLGLFRLTGERRRTSSGCSSAVLEIARPWPEEWS